MFKRSLLLIIICIIFSLTACRKAQRPMADEDVTVITDGDCDSATWDDLCLAKDELSDIYQDVLKKKDSGELPEINDGSQDPESVLSEAADLINEFASAHRYNYNALDARAKTERMQELSALLESYL